MQEYAIITVNQCVMLPLLENFTKIFMWPGEPSVSNNTDIECIKILYSRPLAHMCFTPIHPFPQETLGNM